MRLTQTQNCGLKHADDYNKLTGDRITSCSLDVSVVARPPPANGEHLNSTAADHIRHNHNNVYLFWNARNERLRRTQYIIESLENESNLGPEAIIREMDRDVNPTAQPSVAAADESSAAGSTSDDRQGQRREESENCANENSENATKQEADSAASGGDNSGQPQVPTPEEEPWKIKIKYLNDDLKLVEGKPSQTIGDFKRKHFVPELAANKLVRLVFNGQVRQCI